MPFLTGAKGFLSEVWPIRKSSRLVKSSDTTLGSCMLVASVREDFFVSAETPDAIPYVSKELLVRTRTPEGHCCRREVTHLEKSHTQMVKRENCVQKIITDILCAKHYSYKNQNPFHIIVAIPKTVYSDLLL